MPTKAKTAQPAKTAAKDSKTAKKATEAKDTKATKKAEAAKDTKKLEAPKVEKAAKSAKKPEAPKVDKATKKVEAPKVNKDAKKHEAPEVAKDTKKTEASKPHEPQVKQHEAPKIAKPVIVESPEPPKIPKPPREAGALEKQLSRAIEMLGAGKVDEAYQLFGTIAEEAMGSGHFGLARVARCYLVHKQNLESVPPEADPIQETVFLLNAKKPEAVLDRIETMAKTKNASAHAYYLKALAHASAHQLDLSAQSLKQAIEMDPALLNIYRLEPDFKACRRSPLFADFELA
ncbi:MAG: hypothetical protein LBC63_06800 [Holophagales bacterium]|jgi:hypothetical protein|nr:hypothetical protein [Holophagales bacterium]